MVDAGSVDRGGAVDAGPVDPGATVAGCAAGPDGEGIAVSAVVAVVGVAAAAGEGAVSVSVAGDDAGTAHAASSAMIAVMSAVARAHPLPPSRRRPALMVQPRFAVVRQSTAIVNPSPVHVARDTITVGSLRPGGSLCLSEVLRRVM
jgi:hypothetical protein